MLKTSTKIMESKEPGSEFNITLGGMEIVSKKTKENDFDAFNLKTESGSLNIMKEIRETHPESIVTFVGYKDDVKFHGMKKDTLLSSSVFISMQTNDGEALKIDDDDVKYKLTLNCKQVESQKQISLKPDEASGKYLLKVKLNRIGLTFVEISEVNSVEIWGKINEIPTKNNYHFYYSSLNGQQEPIKVIDLEGIDVKQNEEKLHITVTDQAEGSELCLVMSTRQTTDGNIQKRSTPSNLQLKILDFTPQIYDESRKNKKPNDDIKIRSMEDNYNLVLESNLFGTFTSVIGIITPGTLNFDEIFFNLDEKVSENPFVLVVLLVIFIIYCVLAIFIRHLDKHDRRHWEYVPLVDNAAKDEYLYLLRVYTGIQSPRFFTATPYFLLKGKTGKTDIRILKDGVRKNFRSGTMSNFILQTNVHLGPLQSLKIWHDSEGKSPNWFLTNIEIKDVTTNNWYYFECNNWLAFDKGDGLIIRKLKPTTGQLFDLFEATKTRIYRSLFDDHLYFSIVKRPRASKFTRVQRLSSVTAILYLSLVSSAMFFKPDEKPSGRVIRIGSLAISSKEIFVGIIGSIIMIVPTSMIIFLFKTRKSRGQQPRGDEEKKASIKERLKGFQFPWWTVYIAYLIVFASIGASAFITFTYSMKWGKELSLRWLLSVFVNVSGSILFVQPLKVVFTAMLLSFIFKSPSTEEDKYETDLCSDRFNDLSQFPVVPKESLKICPMPNLASEDWQKKKEILQLDYKLFNMFQSLFFRCLYIVLLLILIANESVNKCFQQNNSIENIFHIKKFSQKGGIELMWDWIEKYAVPGIFPLTDSNGKELKLYDQYFLPDKTNRRLGGIRLRQIRMVKVPCHMSRIIKMCIPNYSAEHEDTKDYLPGWKIGAKQKEEDKYITAAFKYTSEEKAGYSFIHYGIQGSYKSAGYIIDINERHKKAKSLFEKLRLNTWIDERTRVVTIDISTYNANSGLFTSTKIVIERLSCGRMEPSILSLSFKFHPFVDPLDYLVLLIIIIVGILCLITLAGVVIAIKKRRMQALREYHTLINMATVISILVIQIGFGLRIDALLQIQDKLVKNPDAYVSGNLMASRVMVYFAGLCACVVVFAIKLLQPLALNYHLFLMKASIMLSLPSIASFSVVLFFLMTAFAIGIHITFNNVSIYFIDLKSTYLALFRIFLAMGKFKETFGLDNIMSNMVFFIYTLLVSIILLNVCISIINDTFSFVKSRINSLGFEYCFDFKLNEHFWYRMTTLFYKKKISSEEKYLPVRMNSQITKKVFQKFDLLVCESISDFEEISWMLLKKYINCYLDMHLRKPDFESVQTKLHGASDAMKLFQPVFTDLCQIGNQLEVKKICNGGTSWTLWYYWKYKDPVLKVCCKCHNEVPEILCYDVTDKKYQMLPQMQQSQFVGPVVWICQPTTCNVDQSTLEITSFCHETLHQYHCCELIESSDGINWSNYDDDDDMIDCNEVMSPHLEEHSYEDEKLIRQLPCYIALTKRMRAETWLFHGTKLVSSLEPNLSIMIPLEASLSQKIVLRLKLNPYQPIPQLFLTFNIDLQQPITVHFSTTSNTTFPDLQLYSKNRSSQWTEEAIQISQNQGISFKIKPPSKCETVYMLKPSHILWDWQKQLQCIKDPVNKDFLLQVSTAIGNKWQLLAQELNVSGLVMKRIKTTASDKAPHVACFNMLIAWHNSLPVTSDKVKPLTSALSVLGYKQLAEQLNTTAEEYSHKCQTALSDCEKKKFFDFLCRSKALAIRWQELATYLGISEETQENIDKRVDLSLREKCFSVLECWQKYDQELLQKSLTKLSHQFLACRVPAFKQKTEATPRPQPPPRPTKVTFDIP
uniref:Death domain-containing protein n=2 Tax=Octopus bimaculoides TaxID=37653 RepID=A0A0L8HQF0_OCTBM